MLYCVRCREGDDDEDEQSGRGSRTTEHDLCTSLALRFWYCSRRGRRGGRVTHHDVVGNRGSAACLEELKCVACGLGLD